MKILVTGATGFIGSRFCELAIQAGHNVVALVRPGRNLPTQVRVVYGSLPYDVPSRVWEGVEACVHCAAVTTSAAAAESEAINLEGTRFLLAGSKASNVQRFIFLSSQSAHEHAVSAYGITKRKGEELVCESGVPYAILRPGLVYGPGKQGLFWRMRESVRKLPLLPLLGGGHALVQAIHVDDLCTGILRCLDFPAEQNEELNLGDPTGVPLREFLQQIQLAERGQRRAELPIPLGPVKLFVGLGEKLKLPLPISSDNLKGMELVQRMDTAASLKTLGLELRPLADGMRASVRDSGICERDSLGERSAAHVASAPVRLLLIGAGKIGIVHALNARQREDEELVGIVDHHAKAFRFYRSMGFAGPYFTDLAQAVEEQKPDGAIIATPASTHLTIAKWCLERGVAVLIEKPLSIRAEDTREFATLTAKYPAIPCHAGYMAAQYPHLERARQLIGSGELGRVLEFRAVALQSHIMAAKPVRWEMIAAKSGGGAMINFAGHVISMLFRLFGLPQSFRGVRWALHSTEVEDAFAARLDFGNFSGELFSSWSVPGYPRPQNLIEVQCEQGSVLVENFGTSVRDGDGNTVQFWSQREFDLGYNASPDYTGAGFSMEHQNFVHAIRDAASAGRQTGLSAPVTVEAANELEQWMFDFYQRVPLTNPRAAEVDPLISHAETRLLAGQVMQPGAPL